MATSPPASSTLATSSAEIGRAHVYSSHLGISYAVFCLKKKKGRETRPPTENPVDMGRCAVPRQRSRDTGTTRTGQARERHGAHRESLYSRSKQPAHTNPR